MPANENDNDSHEDAVVAASVRANENEQPLDLSSEPQGVLCGDTDKNFIRHNSSNINDNGEITSDSEIRNAVSSCNRVVPSENIPMDVKKMVQHHAIDNRPLRKRKIIAAASEELGQ